MATMIPPPIEAPLPARELARAVLPVLADGASDGPPIGAELADFAIRRHKCGPLLLVASRRGARVDGDAQAMLAQHWAQNKRQHLKNLLSTERIAVALAGSATPAIIFKGAPLAQQLYADPLWRHCGDIDLLVPQPAMIEALQALAAAGLRCDDSLMSLPPGAQRLIFGMTRDVALDDSWTGSHIELHSRPLFSKRLSRLIAARDDTLLPRPVTDAGELASPALGVNLALYLLLHGCVSGWCRLKWLIDLIPLLEKLGAERRRVLADDAERYGVAAALKASLVTLLAVFGPLNVAPLDAWLAEPAGDAAVRSRARRYLAWLGGDERRMPLTTRNDILRSSLMLNDRLSDQAQLLLASGLSSGVRQVARAVVR